MPRSASRRPTDAETEILSVLWECGPSTVRDVHERLGDRRGVGYTTILKLLQIMTDKGLAARDTSRRVHVFAAAVSRDDMQSHLIDDLAQRAFGGSTSNLVMRALSSQSTSAEELAKIRKMLDDMEDGA